MEISGCHVSGRVTRLVSGKLIKMLFIMLMALIAGLWQVSYAASPRNIYFFGDSLSDNGNLYALTYHRRAGATPNPKKFYHGRFSNGLVWSEYLPPMLGITSLHVVNMAYGGAQTGMGNLNDHKKSYPGLQQEVSLFVNKYHPSQLDNANSLYVIWIGADNFLGGVSNPKQQIMQASTQLASAITHLRKQAGMVHLMLVAIPDLGLTPRARAANRKLPGDSSALNKLTNAANKAMRAQARGLQKKLGFSMQWVPSNAWFRRVVQHPGKFGFSNAKQACYQKRNKHRCVQPRRYVFWGSIHPTTRVHQLFARWVYYKKYTNI